MALQITCENCKFTGRVSEEKRGKQVRCPKCGNSLIVGQPQSKRPLIELDDDEEPLPTSKRMTSRRRDDDDEESYGLAPSAPTPKYRPSPIPDPPKKRRPVSRPLLPKDDYSGGEDEGGFGGLISFVLIFGVGNGILYYFTGWIIIPIRR